jgi:hypothetical protein
MRHNGCSLHDRLGMVNNSDLISSLVDGDAKVMFGFRWNANDDQPVLTYTHYFHMQYLQKLLI